MAEPRILHKAQDNCVRHSEIVAPVHQVEAKKGDGEGDPRKVVNMAGLHPKELFRVRLKGNRGRQKGSSFRSTTSSWYPLSSFPISVLFHKFPLLCLKTFGVLQSRVELNFYWAVRFGFPCYYGARFTLVWGLQPRFRVGITVGLPCPRTALENFSLCLLLLSDFLHC